MFLNLRAYFASFLLLLICGIFDKICKKLMKIRILENMLVSVYYFINNKEDADSTNNEMIKLSDAEQVIYKKLLVRLSHNNG